jgi:DNA-binding transcriptional LysR family regulator
MNLDLFALQAFVCVSTELNFSRAATALHISAPRLTRVIQSLEQEVGVTLLARTTHAVSLTLEGEEFLASAQRMLAEADWIGRRFSRSKIASPSSFTVGCLAGSLYDALPQQIRLARAQYPKLQIRLVELEESRLMHSVLDGSLDMGFLYFPEPDEQLAVRVVSRKSQWVALAPDHPLASRKSLTVKDLAGHSMILPDETLAPRLHRWYRSFLDKDGERTWRYVGANQIHVALGLCAAGEGLCVVAEHLRRVRSDDLTYIPLTHAPKTELSAVWRMDSPVRQVAQFIASW